MRFKRPVRNLEYLTTERTFHLPGLSLDEVASLVQKRYDQRVAQTIGTDGAH